MRKWWLLGCLTVCSATLWGGVAAAAEGEESEDEKRARELYENGKILFEEGLYEDAITAWEEAWKYSEKPLLLYNIASAQERLGRWAEAMDTLNRYRAYAPASERATLERRIRNLEDRIAEQGPGEAEEPQGESSTVALVEPPPVVEQPPEREGRLAPVLLFSLGAAGATAGTVFGAMARGDRSDALALCEGESPYLCPEGAAEPLRQDQIHSALADVSFAVGIVGVVGGAVSLRVSSQTSLSLQPGGLVLRGQY